MNKLTTKFFRLRYSFKLLLIIYFFISVFIFSMHLLPCLAQSVTPSSEKLVEQFQLLAQKNPAELIYLQTSKGIYETSEDLWVEAKVKYGNKEEFHRFPVPCKKGNPIQFGVYPEGGKLLADLHSRVAFKAVDFDGNPLDVKGTLFEDDLPIVDFNPLINLIDPFLTINEIRKTKAINYPFPKIGKNIKEESTRPFFVGPNVIEIGEIVVKGSGVKTFMDKYMGQLDSLAKLDLCGDYVGECGLLNCPACTSIDKPIEGKEYSKWISERKPSQHPFEFTADETVTLIYHYPKFTEEELFKDEHLSRVKAYHLHREFYQPNYDSETESDVSPDFRNTLIWAPSVITNEKGEVSLEFFCSDINTPFVGHIEGVCN